MKYFGFERTRIISWLETLADSYTFRTPQKFFWSVETQIDCSVFLINYRVVRLEYEAKKSVIIRALWSAIKAFGSGCAVSKLLEGTGRRDLQCLRCVVLFHSTLTLNLSKLFLHIAELARPHPVYYSMKVFFLICTVRCVPKPCDIDTIFRFTCGSSNSLHGDYITNLTDRGMTFRAVEVFCSHSLSIHLVDIWEQVEHDSNLNYIL